MKSEEKEYKFLIFVFKLDVGPNSEIMESYANEEQLIELGLDPTKDMDIKIDHKGYNIASINLSGKFKDKYPHYKRDLSLRKLFNEL